MFRAALFGKHSATVCILGQDGLYREPEGHVHTSEPGRSLSNVSVPPSRLRAFWTRLEEPVMVLVAHFVLTVLLIVFLEATELLLTIFHLDSREVPLVQVTLSEWMFDLDVLVATVVMIVGAAKAVVGLWRAS